MMRFLLVLAIAAWGAAPALATVAQYEVRGVRSNDVLNMRAAPTHTARIVGRIPHNGREIEIIDRGRGQWVKVSYGRTKGFVNRRFLALSKPRMAAAAKPAPRPEPAQEPQAATAEPAPSADTTVVAVDPRALETPAPAPVASVAPAAPPPPAPAAPEPQKLAVPATAETSLPGAKRDEDETPSLMKPPAEMMPDIVHAVPARLSCSGIAPSWTMTTGGNVGEFETREGEKLRLEFAQLTPATGRNAVWMADGRTASSRLNLHVAETGACRSGASQQQNRYEITLRLEDGRILNGCCQAAGN